MDFILGIIFILLIIFILFNYMSISITNNDKTNYLYSVKQQMKKNNNNSIYLSLHNNKVNTSNNNNLNSILNLKEDSFNYNKYFYL